MCFLFCRTLVVFPATLHTNEAHLGVQKCAGLHAKQSPLGNSQPGSQNPAGSPQAALQSQCCVFVVLISGLSAIYYTSLFEFDDDV